MIKTHQSSVSMIIKFSHWQQGKLEDQSTTNLKFNCLNPAPANVMQEKIAKLIFLNIYFTFNKKDSKLIKTHQSSVSTIIKFSHWRQGKLEDQSTTNLKFNGLNRAPANVKREIIAKLYFFETTTDRSILLFIVYTLGTML